MASERIETPAAKKARLKREKKIAEAQAKVREEKRIKAEEDRQKLLDRQALAASQRAAGVTRAKQDREAAKIRGEKTKSAFGRGAMAGIINSGKKTKATAGGTSQIPSSSYKKTTPAATTASSSASSSGSAAPRSNTKSKSTASKITGKPVSQSRTEWVAKGTVVNGKTVDKGYLAQKGKPEKRVTANVKIVTDTTSGKKAGQTYSYKSGRTMKKGK